MKKLLIDLVWWHLHSLGAFRRREQTLSAAREAGGLLPAYDGWFRECVRLLEQEGYLERQGDRVVVNKADAGRPDELWRRWDEEKARWLQKSDLAAGHVLIEATIRALPDILTGRRAATEILFPGSSLALVENAYKSNPMVALFNAVLAVRIAEHVRHLTSREPGQRVRILEIGAGTGATSAVVLRTLAERGLGVSEYCYTDISKAFLNHAEKSYGPGYPFLTFRTLNIELPIAGQGFDVAGYDIVIAANVLHATRSIRRTLRNTKALLKKNGLLFLNEMTGNNLFNHLTFGLLEGWWLYEDPELRLPGSPGLSVETWRHVLEAERYASVAFPCLGASDLGELIVAESDGVVWLLEGEGRPAPETPGRPVPERESRQGPGPAVKRDGRGERAGDAAALVANDVAPRSTAGDRIGRAIVDELAKSLRVARDRIRPDEPFSTYGLDSILAVQLTRALNEALGVDLDLTAMFEHNTVDALRGHIALAFGDANAPPAADAEVGANGANGANGATRARPAGIRNDAAEGATALAERVAMAVLSESLRIEPSRIRRDEPFASYGLDSILAVSVTRAINEKLGIDLDITALFEHSTMAQLCDFIVANHGAQLREALLATPTARPAPVEAARPAPAEALPPPARVSARPGAPRFEAQRGAEGFAIIGMSGRFPQAEGLDALWRVIERGQRCITAPPLRRDDWKAHADGGSDVAKRWGGFIEGVHEFDPLFFGISMAEARQMSPEQRLMLMYAWNAVEDAGYTPRELANRPTGVFIATGPSEYQPGLGLLGEPSLLSTPLASMIPNRISYAMNLHGPSECCETTCSSSLVALHRAIQAIGRGECVQAIVGGVNLILSPTGFASMEAVGMLSPSGKVRPFQDEAEGTVRSEGVGAIVIKPLSSAIEDGDIVYAVVKGTGVAHGGKGVSFTAPNIRGMKAAMQQAYGEAGVDPGTVTYVEAHGMSSALADSAEIGALSAGLRAASPQQAGAELGVAPAYLGSLKPCLGHAEVFSGLAALMKTVMAIRHKTIPAIPDFGRLGSGISLEGSRIKIATENLAWPAQMGADGRPLPRRAAINSFGIGGVNAHAVLEEYAAGEPRGGADAGPASEQIVVLSARDEDRLRERIRLLAARLKGAPDLPLADVAYTLQLGREAMDCRLAVIADTLEGVVAALEVVLAGGPKGAHRFALATAEQRNAEIVELCSTKAGDALLRSLVAERELDTIATYWVKGASIDWTLLHQGQPRRRVSLPGYPFKRLDCWSQPEGQRSPLASPQAPAAPKRDVAVGPEEFVTGLVASVLGLEATEIDRRQPLNLYGLNSLLLVAMVNHIRSVFPGFQPGWLQAHDTLDAVVARLADVAGQGMRWGAAAHRLRYPELVHLNDATQGRPVFWVHGALGSVETFQAIAGRSKRPFYAIQARGFMTKHPPIEGIATMASHYIDIIRTVQREGPYDVGGFCLGGIISYEMVRQLQLQGEVVKTMVMVDSPDNTGFTNTSANADFLIKNAALQLANTLLWPADEKDLSRVTRNLIHQDEVDSSLDDDRFIAQLASLAAGRGLSMAYEAVIEFIQRNLKVQAAYKLGEYAIQPLARPDAVDCTYFRNRRGLFLGELRSYYSVAEDSFSLDHVNYWQDWERELKRLRIIDIDAANHMTILYEDGALGAIVGTCEELYSE
ncbi:beta-ketoacyl synthase N-terminal-like domain-containing protein [Sorangium sp. So ce1000]|uniref:beta-ketoacyl synthase N-terminal-like domain-containing protein n=1 Tax=Sorangium sp. So ce1000 TaxID=3133325 RepID=UPI003F639F42